MTPGFLSPPFFRLRNVVRRLGVALKWVSGRPVPKSDLWRLVGLSLHHSSPDLKAMQLPRRGWRFRLARAVRPRRWLFAALRGHRLDGSSEDRAAVLECALHGDVPALRLLRRAGAPTDAAVPVASNPSVPSSMTAWSEYRSETPLQALCRSGPQNESRLFTVAWLLKHGAQPRSPDSTGHTPLDWAVRHEWVAAARALLAADADPFSNERSGASPWETAVRYGAGFNGWRKPQTEMVGVFLDAGVDAGTCLGPSFDHTRGDALVTWLSNAENPDAALLGLAPLLAGGAWLDGVCGPDACLVLRSSGATEASDASSPLSVVCSRFVRDETGGGWERVAARLFSLAGAAKRPITKPWDDPGLGFLVGLCLRAGRDPLPLLDVLLQESIAWGGVGLSPLAEACRVPGPQADAVIDRLLAAGADPNAEGHWVKGCLACLDHRRLKRLFDAGASLDRAAAVSSDHWVDAVAAASSQCAAGRPVNEIAADLKSTVSGLRACGVALHRGPAAEQRSSQLRGVGLGAWLDEACAVLGSPERAAIETRWDSTWEVWRDWFEPTYWAQQSACALHAELPAARSRPRSRF